MNLLHALVRQHGGDLAEQLRQLRIVAREVRASETEVDRVRAELFRDHGRPSRLQ